MQEQSYCVLLPSLSVFISSATPEVCNCRLLSIRTESTTNVPTLNLKVGMNLEAFSDIHASICHYFVICVKTCSREHLLAERVRVNRSHLKKTI